MPAPPAVGEPVEPSMVHDVVVRHHRERDPDVEPTAPRRGSTAAWHRLERACDACWIDRAVHHRIGERDADLDGVGAVRRARPDGFLPSRIAAGDVRHQAACDPVRLARNSIRAVPSADGRHPRMSIICDDVLVAPTGQVEQHGLALQSSEPRADPRQACADSSAGMMPSVRTAAGSLDDLRVGDRRVVGPADRREIGVLGADAGIVEPGGDRQRLSTWPHSSCIR